MFMKSKTRYGERFIYNLPDDIKKLSRELKSILKKKFTETDKQAVVFSFIDVGIRVNGYPVNHRVTFCINAIVYATLLGLEWQYWLSTPAGQDMLYGIVNDKKHLVDFIAMLQSASINGGLKETDILRGIPELGINICDPKRYEIFSSLVIGEGINKVAKMGEAAVLKYITKKIVDLF